MGGRCELSVGKILQEKLHQGLAIFPTEISVHKIASALHRATKSFYYGHRNINTPVLAQLYCYYEARVTRFQSRYTLLSMILHTFEMYAECVHFAITPQKFPIYVKYYAFRVILK